MKHINGESWQQYSCRLLLDDEGKIAMLVQPAFLPKHGPTNNIEYNDDDFLTTKHAEITAFVFLPVRRDRRRTSGHRSKILDVIEEAITAGRFPEDFVPFARELVEKMRIRNYKNWLNKK